MGVLNYPAATAKLRYHEQTMLFGTRWTQLLIDTSNKMANTKNKKKPGPVPSIRKAYYNRETSKALDMQPG